VLYLIDASQIQDIDFDSLVLTAKTIPSSIQIAKICFLIDISDG
jgi:hypothetical protein